MSPARVIVVTDAGGDAGLGHLKRCAALAGRLRARGVAAEALVCDPCDTDLARVAPQLPATRLDWWGAPRRVLDAVVPRTVDAFVVDSYHTDEPLLLALRSMAPVVAIDDVGDRPLPVDAVINGTWYAAELAYRVPPEAVRLLGPRYALLDPVFATIPSTRSPARAARVLVTLGGATPAGRIAQVSRAVLSALPDAIIDVAAGLAAADLSSLPGMTVHGPIASLRPLLVGADLAVTAAGMTLYECLATATPAVALCLADNQRLNFERLGAAGLIVAAHTETLTGTVARVAADWVLRERMATDGRRAIDGHGAERTADALVRLIGRRQTVRTVR